MSIPSKEFDEARKEIREVRAELERRPTRGQAWIVICSAVGVLVIVILASVLVVRSINSDTSRERDALTAQVEALNAQNAALIEQNRDISVILMAIEQATGECATARTARNTSRILQIADDIIRDGHGQPRRDHPPLPPLPADCDELAISPPG